MIFRTGHINNMLKENNRYSSFMIKYLGVIFLSVLPLISPVTFSQYVEIKAELDTNQVTIGDQFNLNLYVSHPQGITVRFPEIRDSIAGKIEVIRQYDIDTLISDDRIELNRKILLTCFDTGVYEIPPLPFRLSSEQWNDSIFSNPILMAVYTVPLDSVIRDIKQPIQVPVSFSEIYPYILAVIGLGGIVYCIIYLLRKRRKKEPVFSIARPQEPAHIIALRELDQLKESKLWQRNEYKQYYTRLTEIIRNYIERRFEIPAMEQTSYDILVSWKEKGYHDPNLFDILKQLLNLADLVKFAKEKPLPSDNELNLDNAFVFVKSTKPVSPENVQLDTTVQIPVESTVNE